MKFTVKGRNSRRFRRDIPLTLAVKMLVNLTESGFHSVGFLPTSHFVSVSLPSRLPSPSVPDFLRTRPIRRSQPPAQRVVGVASDRVSRTPDPDVLTLRLSARKPKMDLDPSRQRYFVRLDPAAFKGPKCIECLLNPPYRSIAHSMFPNPRLQALGALIHFLGVTVLTFFLSRQFFLEELTTRKGWRQITWARLCVLLLLFDSYLFLLSTGVLIFGVGLQINKIACAAGIYLCVTFYTTSKLLIYAFLTEKVYIVWRNERGSRLKSPVYLLCMATISLYVGIIVAMAFGRIAQFRPEDGACVIGLKPTVSLLLLAYELACAAALTTSIVRSDQCTHLELANPILQGNTLLTSFKGYAEPSFVCLASCALDTNVGSQVVFNAAAIFWVANGRRAARSPVSEPTVMLDTVANMETVADMETMTDMA
ncbi:hypothetical protein B0H17DRAFT_1182973 [Mycena rosella]|uniref:Transmembrane protein n=1 Tax=Mycena rosella TaxID=1033263 RepID=A0AAD7G7I6_MYCRO|nr:hypothetical protein B0H17DRAFT_1182973 [Mycena rosella]